MNQYLLKCHIKKIIVKNIPHHIKWQQEKYQEVNKTEKILRIIISSFKKELFVQKGKQVWIGYGPCSLYTMKSGNKKAKKSHA